MDDTLTFVLAMYSLKSSSVSFNSAFKMTKGTYDINYAPVRTNKSPKFSGTFWKTLFCSLLVLGVFAIVLILITLSLKDGNEREKYKDHEPTTSRKYSSLSRANEDADGKEEENSHNANNPKGREPAPDEDGNEIQELPDKQNTNETIYRGTEVNELGFEQDAKLINLSKNNGDKPTEKKFAKYQLVNKLPEEIFVPYATNYDNVQKSHLNNNEVESNAKETINHYNTNQTSVDETISTTSNSSVINEQTSSNNYSVPLLAIDIRYSNQTSDDEILSNTSTSDRAQKQMYTDNTNDESSSDEIVHQQTNETSKDENLSNTTSSEYIHSNPSSEEIIHHQTNETSKDEKLSNTTSSEYIDSNPSSEEIIHHQTNETSKDEKLSNTTSSEYIDSNPSSEVIIHHQTNETSKDEKLSNATSSEYIDSNRSSEEIIHHQTNKTSKDEKLSNATSSEYIDSNRSSEEIIHHQTNETSKDEKLSNTTSSEYIDSNPSSEEIIHHQTNETSKDEKLSNTTSSEYIDSNPSSEEIIHHQTNETSEDKNLSNTTSSEYIDSNHSSEEIIHHQTNETSKDENLLNTTSSEYVDSNHSSEEILHHQTNETSKDENLLNTTSSEYVDSNHSSEEILHHQTNETSKDENLLNTTSSEYIDSNHSSEEIIHHQTNDTSIDENLLNTTSSEYIQSNSSSEEIINHLSSDFEDFSNTTISDETIKSVNDHTFDQNLSNTSTSGEVEDNQNGHNKDTKELKQTIKRNENIVSETSHEYMKTDIVANETNKYTNDTTGDIKKLPEEIEKLVEETNENKDKTTDVLIKCEMDDGKEFCTTNECKTISSKMLSLVSLNRKDSCENFYKYACEGIGKDYIHESDGSEEIRRRLKAKLHQIDPSESEDYLLIYKNFFDTCMNYDVIDGLKNAKKILNNLNREFYDESTDVSHIPKLEDVLLDLFDNGFAALFDIRAEAGKGEDGAIALTLEPVFLDDVIDDYKKYDEECVEESRSLIDSDANITLNKFYEKYMDCRNGYFTVDAGKALEVLDVFYDSKKRQKDSKNVKFDFEQLLVNRKATINTAERKRIRKDKMYESLSLSYLQNKIKHIDWYRIFKHLIGQENIQNTTEIHIYHLNYLEEFLSEFDVDLGNSNLRRKHHNSILTLFAYKLYKDFILHQQTIGDRTDYCLNQLMKHMNDISSSIYLDSFKEDEIKYKNRFADTTYYDVLNEIYNKKDASWEMHRVGSLPSTRPKLLKTLPKTWFSKDELRNRYSEVNTTNCDFVFSSIEMEKRNRKLLYSMLGKDPLTPYVMWSTVASPLDTNPTHFWSKKEAVIVLPLAAFPAIKSFNSIPSYISMSELGYKLAKEIINYLLTSELNSNVMMKYKKPMTINVDDKNTLGRQLILNISSPARDLLSSVYGAQSAYDAYVSSKSQSLLSRSTLIWQKNSPDETFFLHLAQQFCKKQSLFDNPVSLIENGVMPSVITVNTMLVNSESFKNLHNCSESSSMHDAINEIDDSTSKHKSKRSEYDFNDFWGT